MVNSQYLRDIVEMDDMGHIACDIRMKTSAPGIFADGDIRQHSNRQLGTAVGDGITAALNAYAYLTEAAPYSKPVRST
ncbi:MAG: hypothetical protein HY678_09935 [Chloroflexi bacterium]|nr:hypothetical protein [Chloroflexota bacterium]